MSEPSLYLASGLTPSSDFTVSKQADGSWSGSMSFFCRDDYWGFSTFKQGDSITEYYPVLTGSWDFLKVNEVSIERQPGGIVRVIMGFAGISETIGDPLPNKDKSGTFAMNATLVETSILEHWRFGTIQSGYNQDAVRLFYEDKARLEPVDDESGFYYNLVLTDGSNEIVLVDEITRSNDEVEWNDDFNDPYENFIHLIQKGIKTFLAPSVEWTQTFVNKGSLTSAEYEQLDYIDPNPAGPPPTFPGRNWRLVSIDQSWENFEGDGQEDSTTFTKTWQLSPPGKEWDALLYTKPEPEE
jgi:hypothetical protein